MMSTKATNCCSGSPYLFVIFLGLLLMAAIVFAPGSPI